MIKESVSTQAWWCTPVIPAMCRYKVCDEAVPEKSTRPNLKNNYSKKSWGAWFKLKLSIDTEKKSVFDGYI
jgi:hypothetical protein